MFASQESMMVGLDFVSAAAFWRARFLAASIFFWFAAVSASASGPQNETPAAESVTPQPPGADSDDRHLPGNVTNNSGDEERRIRYTEFALNNAGDAVIGERLYRTHDQLKCRDCHAITGIEKSGPNLDGIADKYPPSELIKHILYPDAFIQPGYETTALETVDGETLVGRIRLSTRVEMRLLDASGRLRSIKRPRIARVDRMAASMMPENLEQSVSAKEFADLIAYLSTLRSGIQTGWFAKDRPVKIPVLERSIELRPIHPDEIRFENPVWFTQIPGRPKHFLVLEHQRCRAVRLDLTGSVPKTHVFLDLGGEISFGVNQGLMCLEFHPQFIKNGRYFLKYEVRENGTIKTTVNERLATDDRLQDSGKPSRRLLEQEQPAFNHNGGCLAFGSDGMLYVAFGDGGPQRDPPGYSQNPRVFHGSMLRIDVNGTTESRPYLIPPDNPFVRQATTDTAIRPETWAIGFREPWRFSFDRKTGDLWLGDVGQVKFEEICLVRHGENHGWNVLEGFQPFSDQYRRPGEAYVDPVFVYPHSFGVSVTGGYVYRGDSESSFDGVYIFGDYESRRIWGLRHHDGRATAICQIAKAPEHIASFGTDSQGELYMVGYEGTIFRLDLTTTEFPSGGID